MPLKYQPLDIRSLGMGLTGMIAAMTGIGLSASEPIAVAEADEALVLRAQKGDRSALERLLRRHAADIFRLCHFVAGPTDGQDAAQRSLERVVVSIEQFDASKASFRTWALTIARNVCRDRLRRRGLERKNFTSDGQDETDAAVATSPSPERVAISRVSATQLSDALSELPEGMRTAIVMFHVHDASYEEIAESLAVPKGTVMTWLHRGRLKLRSVLEEDAEVHHG